MPDSLISKNYIRLDNALATVALFLENRLNSKSFVSVMVGILDLWSPLMIWQSPRVSVTEAWKCGLVLQSLPLILMQI